MDLGLERYANAFAENGVDLSLLPELTNEDLKDLGIDRLVDRKTILKAIAGISESEDEPATGPSAPIITNHPAWIVSLPSDALKTSSRRRNS